MATERTIIDTSALYALASEKDEFHSRAKFVFETLIDDKTPLFVSSYVFVETAVLTRHCLGYSALQKFVEAIRDDLDFVWIERRVHWLAWDFQKEKAGAGLSFVDWTTVVLARDLNAQVFTFDEGFAREGLPVIPR